MTHKSDTKVRVNAGIPQPRLYGKMQSDRPGFGDSFFKTRHPSIELPGIPSFLVFLPFDSSLPLICPWVTNHPNLMTNDTTVICFAHSLCFGQGSVGSARFCPSCCQLGQLKGWSDSEIRGWGRLKTHSLTLLSCGGCWPVCVAA